MRIKSLILAALCMVTVGVYAQSNYPFNGLDMNMGNLSRLSDAKTRSISPENFTGEKGKGGMADPVRDKDQRNVANAHHAAKDLGKGWKVNPFIIVKPGETITIAEIEGPGAIQQIWMTPTGNWRFSILRMYWDDEKEPSVECPVGDFFCSAYNEYAQLSSLAVCVNPGSAFNCYWKMPFRKKARITLENINTAEEMRLYYQINYTLTEVPEDEAYFHAQFRRSNPTQGSLHTLIDGVKGKGQYVGTYLAWRVNDNCWWGEGEIKFYMDGDREYPTICGDTQWMKDLFPAVKKSLDYCIRTWDPLHKGYLEEPHHNTYDIEFWGPDGMCTSFYLGALTAFIEMGKELKQPVKEYTALLSKGKKYMETALFDGEYFIQKIQWEGLQAPNPVDVMSFGGSYSDEALKLLKEEGPKYQYGTGCLSDGILGMWMASVCGLDEVLDNEKVRSHLVAVHKYNLKHDLVDHFNPQRPVYACGKDGGLLLCTWPKGGMLSLPFVYSNEVWTGIEYQVASHLMMKGEVEKGLDIVRECRERYDGRVRNPFNEIECGHWYARAMASYGMLQGLTGVRYDAVDKTMYINSKIGDFKSFISTDTGFGTIEWKAGKPVLNVVYGNIDVKRYNVSGKIVD